MVVVDDLPKFDGVCHLLRVFVGTQVELSSNNKGVIGRQIQAKVVALFQVSFCLLLEVLSS